MQTLSSRHPLHLLAVVVVVTVLGGCLAGDPITIEVHQAAVQADDDDALVSEQTAADLQAALEEWYADPSTRVLGAVAGVLGPDGMWTGAVGARDLDVANPAPMEPDTIVSFGSITKHVTTMRVLLAVEQGLISLDDVVPVTCPPGAACPGAAQQPTVRDLLINRSGFYTVVGIDDFAGWPWVFALPDLGLGWNLSLCAQGIIGIDSPCIVRSPDALVQHEVGGRAPLYPPQSQNQFPSAWAYVNSNWILLQRLLEERTGRPYFETVDQELFEPLGLDSFYQSNARDGSAVGIPGTNDAAGHLLLTDSRGCMGGVGGYGVSGAGGLRGTVSDMLHLVHALHAGQILRPETVELMMTPGGPEARGLIFMPQGYGGLYAMGTSVEPLEPGDWHGPMAFGHDGGQTGFSAIVRHVPATGTTVVVVANTWTREPEAKELFSTLHAIATRD